MKLTLRFALLLTPLFSFAQGSEDFMGLWNFKTLTSEKLGDKEIKMMNGMFESMTFIFDSNGGYVSSVMGSSEIGKYEVKNDGKQLLLTSEAGIIQDYIVSEINDRSLVLLYNETGLAFTRNSDWKEEILKQKEVLIESPEFSEDQLIGNWAYEEFNNTNSEASEMGFKMVLGEDDHLDLKKNRKYRQSAFEREAKGKWELSENKKLLLLHSKKGTRSFPIVSITESELILDLEVNGTFVILKK